MSAICFDTDFIDSNSARLVELPPITFLRLSNTQSHVNAIFCKNICFVSPPVSESNPISTHAPVKLCTGCIKPYVNVPVLSVHNSWIFPDSGILCGFFANIFERIIRSTFCPVIIPIINGKPSGTAATNIVSAIVSVLNTTYKPDISCDASPDKIRTVSNTPKITNAHIEPNLLIKDAKLSSWICNVVLTSSIEYNEDIILAFSVFAPTRVTRI